MRPAALAAVAALLSVAACAQPPPAAPPPPGHGAQTAPPHADPRANQGLERVEVAVATARGTLRWPAELALTPAQQQTGMQHRHAMARGEAMLFPLGSPRVASFWMVDTHVPLDMLFIDEGARIARIVHAAPPLSAQLHSSGVPVVAVLEISGGEARRLGIAEGDLVSAARAGLGLPVHGGGR